jgi:RNA polymerase sigma factor (sigma-70 family)
MAFVKNIDNQQDDAALLAQFKLHGDKSLLAQLFQRHMDQVYGVCVKYLEDRELAKDEVMNIYLELERKLPNHEVQNFKSWLYVLAKNHCLMYLRSHKSKRTVSFDGAFMQNEQEWHLDEKIEKEGQLKQMEHCIEGLSAEQKEGIVLFYLKRKSYQEIAALTGMDWGKVRSLIQNGRRNLKICMEKK